MTILKCSVCGNVFRRLTSAKTCSRRCAKIHWKKYFGTWYAKNRDRILERRRRARV